MTDPRDIVEIRNATLQKIGRNVVKFQKMEGMLKFLNSVTSISGPVSEIAKIQKNISKSVAKQPMGRLADAFVRTVYANHSKLDDESYTGSEVHISMTISFEDGEKFSKERQLALNQIVASRNNLIHKWLVKFDPDSIESCIELGEKLDDQREKMIPECELLRGMVLMVLEYIEESRKFVESHAFREEIKKLLDGA